MPRFCLRSQIFAVSKSLVITIGYLLFNVFNNACAWLTLPSSIWWIKLESCSARNERMETAKCKFLLRITWALACNRSSSSPSAYSLPVNWSEIKTFQSGKLALIARNHSPIPASPVLISWPPPTKQTTTAQSSRRFNDQIKNSGSDIGKLAIPFLRLSQLAKCVFVHARCASSKIATCSTSE